MNNYTIKIPSKTYLCKYIYSRYGKPFPLNNNTSFGTLILCLLDKESFITGLDTAKKDVRLSFMTDLFECTAPIKNLKYKNYSLTEEKSIAINRFIENEFDEELSKFCQNNILERSWRPGIVDAIELFCKRYSILLDIDITADALRKREYRFRKRRGIILHTFVPPQSKPTSSIYIN